MKIEIINGIATHTDHDIEGDMVRRLEEYCNAMNEADEQNRVDTIEKLAYAPNPSYRDLVRVKGLTRIDLNIERIPDARSDSPNW